MTASLERGWWLIDIPDIGTRTRAATLATVEPTARRIIARSIGTDADAFGLHIHTLRVTHGSIVRASWQSPGIHQAPRVGGQAPRVILSRY